MKESIHLQDIWLARNRIQSYVQHTPLIFSEKLSESTGKSIYLKLENLNTTRSFKIRGATNKILSLTDEEKERGITTFSTGNFGFSVAAIAKELGIRAVICISKQVPKTKVEKLQQIGAEVQMVGKTQDDAQKYSYQLAREKGFTVIHPFDDPQVIAGQGTIGLEIIEDLPTVDTILAGLSGGGLLSGIGTFLKNTNPSIQLIGLSPENGAAMYESIQRGKPVLVKERPTLADSLLGGIGENNQYTFQLVQDYVDQIVLLNEKEIADGMVCLLKEHGLIVEGAASVGVGAILNERVRLGSNVVIVISGASVDPSIVLEMLV